jgi:hypothetical protein
MGLFGTTLFPFKKKSPKGGEGGMKGMRRNLQDYIIMPPQLLIDKMLGERHTQDLSM